MSAPILLFLYLQVLDVITTLIGFRVAGSEANPFVRLLLPLGPAAAVVASKLVATLIAGAALALRRPRIVAKANYWYGALILWNLTIILRLANK